MGNTKVRPPDEVIIDAIKGSDSIRQTLIKIGLSPVGSGNYETVKNIIAKYEVNVDHFYRKQHSSGGKGGRRFPLETILIENSTYSNANGLKKRLIKEGVLENKCKECGLDPVWNHKKLTLQIEHINGNRKDNRIENLSLLCPNCHSQTETFTGKNKKLGKSDVVKKICSCGKLLRARNNSGFCTLCRTKNGIKIIRKRRIIFAPNLEELKELVKTISLVKLANKYGVNEKIILRFCRENGILIPNKSCLQRRFEVQKEELERLVKEKSMLEVGRMFGVSDNAIRKRCKRMGINWK